MSTKKEIDYPELFGRSFGTGFIIFLLINLLRSKEIDSWMYELIPIPDELLTFLYFIFSCILGAVLYLIYFFFKYNYKKY